MKKLLLLLLLFLLNYSSCLSQQSTDIKFIYLNGSNTNTEKKRNDFVHGIFNVQRVVKSVLENDSYICQNLLKNGLYKIDKEPLIFFWGFESKDNLNEITTLLQKTREKSTFLASQVRDSIVRNVHDIIWIERVNNMQDAKNKLHQMVLAESYNNKKIILAGHSAGAFITYNYILYKIKNFNTKLFLPYEINKTTCLDAIIESEIGIKQNNGKLIKNPNEKILQKGYRELDFYTKTECVSDGLILGVVNFGSPQPLFYPDIIEKKENSEYIYQKNFIDYIQTHDLFYLTLNYKEDTLSILPKYNTSKKSNNSGFIYTYMQDKSPSTFINAHYTYWKHPKHFARMLKSGFIEASKYHQ